jgi:Zn-dependent M28 family amino/carboxypeptidase
MEKVPRLSDWPRANPDSAEWTGFIQGLLYEMVVPRPVGSEAHGKMREILQGILSAFSDAGYRTLIDDHDKIANYAVEFGNGSGEPIVIGAHYDTVPTTPGASDNLSGIVAAITAAKHLAETSPECTALIVFFDAEEPPYFMSCSMGSMQFYSTLLEKWGKPRAAIIYDMIGHEGLSSADGKPAIFVGGIENDGLTQAIHSINSGAEIAYIGYRQSYGGQPSDHAVFREEGIPALFFSAGYFPGYHNSEDTEIDWKKSSQIGIDSVGMIDTLLTHDGSFKELAESETFSTEAEFIEKMGFGRPQNRTEYSAIISRLLAQMR